MKHKTGDENMDLKFGWRDYTFILHNIKINNYILGRKDKDIEFEYDKLETIRYLNSNRVLTATAQCCIQKYNDLYLGIPHNKVFDDSLERVESISFMLREQNNNVKYGYSGFNKGDEELSMEDEVFVEVYAPTNIFNYIENLLDNNDTELFITVVKKGWYWLGPIGDSHLHIDIDNLESVLFSSIGSKKNSNLNVKKDKKENKKHNFEMEDIVTKNNDILKKISDLSIYLSSIKFAMWIIVFIMIINILFD